MAPGRLSRCGRIELTVGLLALAGIVAAGTALAARRAAPVEPGLVVEPGDLDFGTAWEQPALRHAFAVTNPTDRPVRVAEIKTGCGCTKVEPQAFTVPPDGRQELAVTLDLTGRAGNGRIGSFRVELLPLIAHQPPGGRTTWELAGNVRRNPIELSEPAVDFGDDVIAGEPVPIRTIDVSLADGSPFDDLRAETDVKSGAARIEPAGPGRWRLEVAPAEGLPHGPFEFTVRLTAAGDGTGPFPAQEVRVTGTVRHDIAAWPAAANFGGAGGRRDGPGVRRACFPRRPAVRGHAR